MLTKSEILAHPDQLSGELRLKVLKLYNEANAGHIGCSLSCIDLIVAVLFLNKAEEDTFILSKGHAAASLYASLNLLGEISDAQLATYYLDGTTLPAHPAAGHYSGIPFATGSLGHGFPIAAGVAHASKIRNDGAMSYVLMSDGETNEGTTWEAAHYALANQLDNLIVVIDKNGLQGFAHTKDVLGETAAPEKWRAIGFEVLEVNGHDIEEINRAVQYLKGQKNGIPKVIVANTIKGKGVSYMENRMEWHYLPMNPAQFDLAVQEVTEKYLNQLADV